MSSTKTDESLVRELFKDMREGFATSTHPLRDAVYSHPDTGNGPSNDEFTLEVDEKCFHFTTEFACKQFCRSIPGFGYALFSGNDPALNTRIVENWLPELKSESYHLRVTPRDDGTYQVHGMISGDEFPLSLLGVLDSFSDTPNFQLDYWEEESGDCFLRYLTGDAFEFDGREWRHGLTVSFSDIGGTPLTVDHFVKEISTGIVFVVNYETSNFLRVPYKDFDAEDLGEFWDTEVARFEGMDMSHIRWGMENAVSESWTVSQMDKRLQEMGIWKGLSSKFAAALAETIAIEGLESYLTSWKLARKIASQAKDAPSFPEQMKIERVAGRVAGLVVPEINGKKLFKDFLKDR